MPASLVFALLALVALPDTTYAAGGEAPSGSSVTPLSAQLVVPSAQPLEAGEQQRAAAEAQRNSPEAVMRREESRTKFASESSAQASQTDRATFPAVIDRPSWTPVQAEA
jgi:hypothetical protein